MTIPITGIFIILATILVVSTTTTSAYAGGPRLDYPDDATEEGANCWVNGYDAGFAGKYDKNRADECKENGEDNYNDSWGYACKDAGYMIDECESFKNNPVDTVNPNSLEEENRRTCYDDGYEDGGTNAYDRERENRCSEFGSPYRDGFMAACDLSNSYDFCNSFTETTQIQEQTNVTTGASVPNEQDIRYYDGFDWLGVCNNPLIRNYITQSCDVLVTSDGNALTSDGKAAMENVLCPKGRGIIGTIELFYKPIPNSLEEELASTCGWS
jgi:hypothetical protein